MSKKYINKDGELYNGISIISGTKRIINPTEGMLFKAGYVVYEESDTPYEPTEEELKRKRMDEILEELAATDYLVMKAYEGEDMTKYGDWKTKRHELREEYTKLESEIYK